MRKPSWGLSGAYALLALAVAATALTFAILRVVNDSPISGAGPGYRYYALGIQRSTGPDFALNTPLIELMAGKWPPGLDSGGMLSQTVAFSSSARHRSTPTFQAELVAGTYLQAMHVAPLGGRLLTLADVRNGRKVVVLNAKLARHLFGSVQAAVGQRLADTSGLALKGLSLQVVGVVPAAFGGVSSPRAKAWLPYTRYPVLNNWEVSAGTQQTMAQAFALSGIPAVLSVPTRHVCGGTSTTPPAGMVAGAQGCGSAR